MPERGLSPEGLAQLHDALADHVESRKLPGLVSLVARGDEVHVDAIGRPAVGATRTMARDSVFRIASLTKPIAALGALILVDDGVLRLDAPVDDLLPELAKRRVLRSLDADLDDTVAARRSITLDDLLTFRMGFGTIMAPPDTYPIQTAEAELRLMTLGPPWPPSPHTPDEWIRAFASLPLMHQPGEEWMYNTGSQVLGVLIERAAGKPLEVFLRERIFAPLGMRDTGFHVRPEQRDRFTTAYAPDPESGTLHVLDPADDSWWSTPPALPNAAGWLVSTIDDYWAFVKTILRSGVHDGERIVSAASVARMTTDHLDARQRAASALFLGETSGWGYGMAVPAASGRTGIPGGFGWEGGSGTTWRSDVGRGLTGILFTQRAMTSPEPPEIFVDFWKHAYAAIDN